MAEHEFITVGERRWCVNCELFHKRLNTGWPSTAANCRRTTPRAKAVDKGEKPNRGGPRIDAEWGNHPHKEACKEG